MYLAAILHKLPPNNPGVDFTYQYDGELFNLLYVIIKMKESFEISLVFHMTWATCYIIYNVSSNKNVFLFSWNE